MEPEQTKVEINGISFVALICDAYERGRSVEEPPQECNLLREQVTQQQKEIERMKRLAYPQGIDSVPSYKEMLENFKATRDTEREALHGEVEHWKRMQSQDAAVIEELRINLVNLDALRPDAELGRLVRLMEGNSALVRRGNVWLYSDSRGGSGERGSAEDALRSAGVGP